MYLFYVMQDLWLICLAILISIFNRGIYKIYNVIHFVIIILSIFYNATYIFLYAKKKFYNIYTHTSTLNV